MNDRMKESLSALVDGEADELEIRRLLNQLEGDDELRASWQRYQLTSELMRADASGEGTPDETFADIDLSRGIMQAIDGEPMEEVPAKARPQAVEVAAAGRRGINWLASAAVAASVTLAVLVGVRLNQESLAPQLADQAALPQSDQQLAGHAAVPDSQQLQQAQRKLQQYVLQHTENAALNTGKGMMPYARVASFDQPDDEAAEAVPLPAETADGKSAE